MNIEDIKVGEWYNVPFKVKEIKSGDIHLINGGIKAVCQPSELSVIGEASMPRYVRVDTSNDIDLRSSKYSPLKLSDDDIKEFTEWLRQKAESTPKYDPCRKFRKGDIVTPKERNGRIPWAKDTKLIVVDNERMAGVAVRNEETGEEHFICALFLELVTPAEELEPYFVGESENSYDLFRKTSGCNQLRASFWWKHNPTPELIELSKANAKAAAEAERDRLNAEWRKEQRNG